MLARAFCTCSTSRQITRLTRLGGTQAVTMASVANSRPQIRGILFDMDGTLTKPVIDFNLMRRRCGILEGDILTVLDSMPPEQQLKARKAIEEVEQEALDRMELMPDLHELAAFMDKCGLPRALITRNTSESVQFFHRLLPPGLAPFSPALSREFLPYKPSPDALLHICKSWGIAPQHAVMVGDSAKDDMLAGRRAGCVTVLLDGDHHYTSPEDVEEELRPDFVIRSLSELCKVLSVNYDVPGQNVPTS